MKTYIAIIHKDDESSYGVHFPDVPGCFSAGDTLDSAIKNSREALSLFFEDQDLTPASSFEDIKKIAKEDIASGAILAAIPFISLSGRTVRANITMDAGLLNGIDKVAKNRGLSRSSFLSQAAQHEISGYWISRDSATGRFKDASPKSSAHKKSA